jgi:uncharacterized protein
MVFGLAYFTPVTGFAGGALIGTFRTLFASFFLCYVPHILKGLTRNIFLLLGLRFLSSLFPTGLSAAVLLLFSGDILGASGLVSSTVLSPRTSISDPAVTWKLVLLSAFLLVANLVLGKSFVKDERLGVDPSIPVVSLVGYILGGLLVGFGTKLSNGCTTGHGICGMARFSKRSTAAVCSFMISGLAMACITAPNNQALSKYTRFLRTDQGPPDLFSQWLGLVVSALIVLPTILALANLFGVVQLASPTIGGDVEQAKGAVQESANEVEATESSFDAPESASKEEREACPCQEPSQHQKQDNTRKLGPAAVSGILFAVGLAVSGMVLPSKILGFLNLLLMRTKSSYDPTLMCVMMGGLVVSAISYQFVENHQLFHTKKATRECPVLVSKFSIPTNTTIDADLIGGSICFGMGWAVAGLCPGPALFLAATGTHPVLLGWWPAFFVGSLVAQKLKKQLL